MNSGIQAWIKVARVISKHILKRSDALQEREVKEWCSTNQPGRKILDDLNDAQFYKERILFRERMRRENTWETFMVWRKQRERRRKLRVIRVIRGVAAVAVVFICIGVAVHYKYQQVVSPIPVIASIEPGSKKACLVMDDGSVVALDGKLKLKEADGTMIVNNEKGEVLYRVDSTWMDSIVRYDKLSVPRGGEYQIQLSDGTRVWMNSASELIFPKQFGRDRREVILRGEAYFEIARDAEKPFYVMLDNGLSVRATGTEFNITAYADDMECKITLLEGGVNIEKEQQIVGQLKPRMQFCLNNENDEYKICNVDTRVATAWRNGLFFFEDESLKSIIAKLSRWYNIEIMCKSDDLYKYKFSGQIQKYEDAIKVLDMLKLTNEIAYMIQSPSSVVLYEVQ